MITCPKAVPAATVAMRRPNWPRQKPELRDRSQINRPPPPRKTAGYGTKSCKMSSSFRSGDRPRHSDPSGEQGESPVLPRPRAGTSWR